MKMINNKRAVWLVFKGLPRSWKAKVLVVVLMEVFIHLIGIYFVIEHII